MLHVLAVYMNVVGYFLLCEVGELGAVFRTDGVDVAHVGLTVEELAGSGAVHPFTLAVFVQPFLPELFYGHSQVCCDALQVLEGKGGRHCPAAVGAGKTIHFFPYFTVKYIGIGIQCGGWIILYLGEETTQPGTVLQHTLSKLLPVVRHIIVACAEGKRILKVEFSAITFVYNFFYEAIQLPGRPGVAGRILREQRLHFQNFLRYRLPLRAFCLYRRSPPAANG